MGDRVNILQSHHAVSKEAESPASGTIRRRTTGEGDEMGFSDSIKRAVILAPSRFPLQRGIYPILYCGLAYPRHRRHADIQRGVDHGIGPRGPIGAFVRFEERRIRAWVRA